MSAYLTIEEACKRLGVTRQTLYNWRKERGLPVEKTAVGHVRVSALKLEAWRAATVIPHRGRQKGQR